MKLRVLAKEEEDISAVEFRHDDIQQDDLRLKEMGCLQGLGRIVDHLHFEFPGPFQVHLQHVGEMLIIIDGENFVGHGETSGYSKLV